VLYSSATGASEPGNLGYMTRLGSGGHPSMQQLIAVRGWGQARLR
jgi:hypothetical protein